MECNSTHREMLLVELERAQLDVELSHRCMAASQDTPDPHLHDVGLWLAQARVELIKEAIKNNELQNY